MTPLEVAVAYNTTIYCRAVPMDPICRCGHYLKDHYPRGGSDCIECDVCDGNEFCEDFHPPKEQQ